MDRTIRPNSSLDVPSALQFLWSMEALLGVEGAAPGPMVNGAIAGLGEILSEMHREGVFTVRSRYLVSVWTVRRKLSQFCMRLCGVGTCCSSVMSCFPPCIPERGEFCDPFVTLSRQQCSAMPNADDLSDS